METKERMERLRKLDRDAFQNYLLGWNEKADYYYSGACGNREASEKLYAEVNGDIFIVKVSPRPWHGGLIKHRVERYFIGRWNDIFDQYRYIEEEISVTKADAFIDGVLFKIDAGEFFTSLHQEKRRFKDIPFIADDLKKIFKT